MQSRATWNLAQTSYCKSTESCNSDVVKKKWLETIVRHQENRAALAFDPAALSRVAPFQSKAIYGKVNVFIARSLNVLWYGDIESTPKENPLLIWLFLLCIE